MPARGRCLARRALSPAEGAQAALLTTPDLMIVDVRLGAGSGIAAVERILQSGFIPHVFATGDIPTDGGLHERAVAMRKPYDEADLVRAIALAAGRGDSAPTARWTSRARSSSE